MAIQLTNTKQAAIDSGVKILMHGPAGVGKTYSVSTIGEPTLLISAESGTLSLRDFDIPMIEVASIDEVNQVYEYVTEGEGQAFKWIVLDSVSEIAEVVLSEEKALTKDPRKAYGELQDHMMKLLRAFRDLKGRNVVFTCKQDYIKDDQTGVTRFSPLMPGQNLQKQIPYIFDFVFALRVDKDPEGNEVRYFQTHPDIQYTAKQRGGALDMYEPADLSHIAKKLQTLSTTEPLKEVQ